MQYYIKLHINDAIHYYVIPYINDNLQTHLIFSLGLIIIVFFWI